MLGVKGMLVALTDNPGMSVVNRSFFLLLSHIKSQWQWGRDRTRDESAVINVLGRVQALPSFHVLPRSTLTSARKLGRERARRISSEGAGLEVIQII